MWPQSTVAPSNSITKLKNAVAEVSKSFPSNKKLMLTPPTIVQEASLAHPSTWATPLTSAVLVPFNSVALPNSGLAVSVNPLTTIVAPERLFVAINNLGYNDGTKFDFLISRSISGGSPGQYGMTSFGFNTDAPYFGIALCGTTSMIIRIDGEYVTPRYVTYTIGGSLRFYISLNFGNIRKSRLIEFFIIGGSWLGVGGVAIGPNDSIWPRGNAALTIVADGDSYLQGPGESFVASPLSEVAAAIRADFCCHPVGGTGYLQVNGSYPNALTRIAQVTAPYDGKPDIVMIALGINDPKDSTPTANVNAYYMALRVALPSALFVVLGPWCPTESSGSLYNSTIGAQIVSAVKASGGNYLLIDNIAGTFQTSWGTSGSIGGKPWQTGSNFTLVGSAAVDISSISRTTNVVTCNTLAVHGLTTNDTSVLFESGSFDGQFTCTVVTTTQFTYPQTLANETGSQLGKAGKLLVAGSGSGSLYSSGDATHLNKTGYDNLSLRLMFALKTALATYPG